MNRSTLILLILLSVFAFGISTCDDSKPEPEQDSFSEITPKVKEFQNNIQEINLRYLKSVQRLLKENDSLQFAVRVSKENFEFSKKKTTLLQIRIDQLSGKLKQETDTTQKLALCDSLSQKVNEFTQATALQDSICENTITEFERLVENKDSTINTYRMGIADLKSVVDQSLTEQQRISDQLNTANKIFKKEKRKNRLLSVGLIAVSSGAITFLATR